MSRRSAVVIVALALGHVWAQAPSSVVVERVIGSGSGDAASAVEAILDGPFGLAEDAVGNVYISESNAGVIRRVDSQGIIHRFAGTRVIADGAAGRSAIDTDLMIPAVLLIDRDGGLFFSDSGACRIRKVRTDGTIVDVAGTGRCNDAASGPFGGGVLERPPLEIDIGVVGGMVLDSSGQLVFSDQTNHVVRRIGTDGIVHTLAGTGVSGYSGDGQLATDANMSLPKGLVYDVLGNLYVADSGNCRVRRIGNDGNISTTIGGVCSATSSLGRIPALAYDAGQHMLLISAPNLGQIQKLDLTLRNVTIVAGNGQRGPVESAAPLNFSLDQPNALLLSGSHLLIADTTSFRVLKLENNLVIAFAGKWPQLDVYPPALAAPLLRPRGLCIDRNGALLVVDEGAERILAYRRPNNVLPFAGARYPTGYSVGDGASALAAQFNKPIRVACASDGTVYVSHASRVRAISPQGVVQTLIQTVSLDNASNSVNNPTGVAVDSSGRLLLSETGANRVLRYDPATRRFTRIAGTGTAGFRGDGAAATDAQLNAPGDLAFDSRGNLLIADSGNGRIRRVTASGMIETIVGSALGFSYSDISGQAATAIGLGQIQGMTVDAAGDLYISEPSRVSVVRGDGRIYVLAGYIGEDNQGVASYLRRPMNDCDGLAVDAEGRLYVSLRHAGEVVSIIPDGLAVDGERPVISGGGVVSNSAFGGFASVSPGSWVEIYGANLAAMARSWASEDFKNGRAPTVLGSTTVAIGGKSAFLSYVSPGQLNMQVPSDLAPGLQDVTVTTNAGTSDPYGLRVNAVQPGLFAPAQFRIGGKQYAGAILADGTTFTLPEGAVSGIRSRPVRSGERITVFGLGFGAVTPAVAPGIAPAGITALVLPVQFSIGGQPAALSYAGLAPGTIGLYQFNLTVPAIAAAGDAELRFILQGEGGSQTLYLAVQP